VVAGVIEGFVSAGTLGLAARAGASAASILFLAVYLLNGRGHAAGAAGGPATPRAAWSPAAGGAPA
jgi:hypothetical protein